MTAIKELWQTLSSQGLPPEQGLGQVDGVDLAELNQQVFDTVQYYIKHESLSIELSASLTHSIRTMQRINPQLQGKLQLHFGLLYRICDLISTRL